MSHGTELERIAMIARRLGAVAPGTVVGIGDDAAVLAPTSAPLVWTVDAQVEGTHFRLDWVDYEDIGWRSFMAAASDLAAMGASPLAALSSLVLSDKVDDQSLDRFLVGQAAAAATVGAPIVGGNLARGTETSITTTVLGTTPKAVLRDGARAGDGVHLAGAVGEAAAGLRALMGGSVDARSEACVMTWRRPQARIADGLALRDVATAAIDVSDGLSRDVSHIAEASKVTVVLEERALRIRASEALVHGAAAVGADLLDLALAGGEDYAVVATAPGSLRGFDRIGRVESGSGEVILERADGTRIRLDPRGFDHFARAQRP